MSNQYAVLGTMQLLANKAITTQQAEEIVNIWIEATAKRFYAEGMLDGKRSKVSLSDWQRIKDMGM